ncbi:MAG: hypothetical protein NZ870_03815, partial [bacterium]|nr:hypothetical protein [bacterium]
MIENILILNTFTIQITQGFFSLFTAADVCEGKWHLNLKEKSKKFIWIILIPAILSLLHLKSLNLILTLATIMLQFFTLKLYYKNNSKTLAIVYLILFVFFQSYIAFFWIMPLEEHFISALLGAYFFVEAFHCGIALSIILLNPKEKLLDLSTLLFAFSLLWAGFLF